MEREYYYNGKPISDDQQLQSPACPRCGSINTKFCYYNNYSLTQPRYFCKGCRRYWTKGGSLRNVPIGGGCRKSRRRPTNTTTTINNRPAVNSSDGGGAANSISSAGGHHNNHGGSTSSIDLAAVYANFLNNHQQPPPTQPCQPPENINQINLPPLPDGILNIPSIEFSGFHQEVNHNHGFFECGPSSSFTDNTRLLMLSESSTPPLLGGGSSDMFFDGLLFQKHAGNNTSFINNGMILPPLPAGEDHVVVANNSDQGMLWPDSDVILPATHETAAGAAVGAGGQNSELVLSGNLSPFSDGLNNLEAIFRS